MSDQPTQQWQAFQPSPQRIQQRQARQQMPSYTPHPQPRHTIPRNDAVWNAELYPPVKRKKRVFLWVFLAIQAIFILWIVVGLATVHTGPTQADLASVCYGGHWFPIFKSQADCVTHYGHALQVAGNAGKGLGVAIIVMLWFVVDVILGISYGIYRLATRR